jgi:hypothetical protein
MHGSQTVVDIVDIVDIVNIEPGTNGHPEGNVPEGVKPSGKISIIRLDVE